MESTDNPAEADAALLQLIWLASPALPVGGFSYSEGLEAAVEAALVRDESSAGDWLVQQLHLALARGDLAAVASAVEGARAGAAQRLAELDDWVRQTRETSELRQQAEQMGRSMGEWQRSLSAGGGPTVGWGDAAPVGWGDEGTPEMRERSEALGFRFAPPPACEHPAGTAREPAGTGRAFTYPVAFALAAAGTQASPRQAALAYAFGWSENMVQAAVKAVPLGQAAGQRILGRLARAIPAAVDHALGLRDEDRQAFAPMLAILSSQHECQYSRLFRS